MSAPKDAMGNLTQYMLDSVDAPNATRRTVSQSYARALFESQYCQPPQSETQWGAVNARIMERWSPSGLVWIKTAAWKQAQAVADRAHAQGEPRGSARR